MMDKQTFSRSQNVANAVSEHDASFVLDAEEVYRFAWVLAVDTDARQTFNALVEAIRQGWEAGILRS